MLMKVVKCPSDELSKTNCAILSTHDMHNAKHIKVTSDQGDTFLISVKFSPSLKSKEIGLSALHRAWLGLKLWSEIDVTPFVVDQSERLVSMMVEIDKLGSSDQRPETYNADEMVEVFRNTFSGVVFDIKQLLAFEFKGKVFRVTVIDLEAINVQDVLSGTPKPQKVQFGVLNNDVDVSISAGGSRLINLVGKSLGFQTKQSIIAPDFDFNELGIGGLDKEFGEVFRRAFTSRMFSSNIVEQCGGKHVKGILLYGPPGTGKTLIARKIGGMLRSHPPKVVNGPEVLNKFVGESEANVRRLFAEAEEEEKRLGPASALHIIIFDEIDAICKQRSSVPGSTGVNETVVNQLLSKIDGVEQLNNVLIIGMTNRLDMIDEALLRPGRFEVKVEIGLPDEQGRLQILKIHTELMIKNDRLDTDVNLEELAKKTKNFTGAELEALTRAALSIALNRAVKVASKAEIDEEIAENLKISQNDFLLALENDVRPAFGTNSAYLENYAKKPFINFSEKLQPIMHTFNVSVNNLKEKTENTVFSILLEGAQNCGKTTLACKLALETEFPFIKVCTPMEMMGFSENSKSFRIQKIFDDAYKSPLSCILISDIENLLDYGPIGPRYSTVMLKTFEEILKTLPPKNHRLLIIATTKSRMFLSELLLLKCFSKVFHVPNVTNVDELKIVLQESQIFDPSEIDEIATRLKSQFIDIGIKELLTLIDGAKQDERKVEMFLKMLKDHQDEY